MSTAVYPTGAAIIGAAESVNFTPELWSDEVIASYKSNLKAAPLVRKYSMVGKKGDTLHVPKPIRGAAAAKGQNAMVTIQANVEPEMSIAINRHFEYSRFIEDFAAVQALPSQRRFYTDDAGYQLAKQIDSDLLLQAAGFAADGSHDTATVGADAVNAAIVAGTLAPANWVGSTFMWDDGDAAGTEFQAYAEDALVEADRTGLISNFDVVFRNMLQELDERDVPMDNRNFIIDPTLKNVMMGIERYVSSDFRDDRTVKSGLIGQVYGVDIYVSTNAPTIETAAQNGASSGLASKSATLFHTDALILAEQKKIRSQVQYKQEWLSTLYTSDCIYGFQCYRPEGGVVLAVPQKA
jgi:hypothetical protein